MIHNKKLKKLCKNKHDMVSYAVKMKWRWNVRGRRYDAEYGKVRGYIHRDYLLMYNFVHLYVSARNDQCQVVPTRTEYVFDCNSGLALFYEGDMCPEIKHYEHNCRWGRFNR